MHTCFLLSHSRCRSRCRSRSRAESLPIPHFPPSLPPSISPSLSFLLPSGLLGHVVPRCRSDSPHLPPGNTWSDVVKDSSVANWKLNIGDLIERKCPACADGHKTIVYKRLTKPENIDFRNLFLHQWYSDPLGGSNVLDTDFALYDSAADAQVLPPPIIITYLVTNYSPC